MQVLESQGPVKTTGSKVMDNAYAIIDRAGLYHNLTSEAVLMVNDISAMLARKARVGTGTAQRLRQKVARLENELRVVDMLDLLRNIVLNTTDGEKFSFPMKNGRYALCVDGVSRGAFFTMQSLVDDGLPDDWIDGIPTRVYFSEFTAALDPKLLGKKPFPKPITKAVRWIYRNGGIDFVRQEPTAAH